MTITKNLARLLLAWQLVFGANVAIIASDFAPAESESAAVEGRAGQDDAGSDSARARRKGLRFRLSRGGGQAETPAPGGPKVARAERLSESETQKILGRLPPLETVGDDKKDFALRERTLPPPRTGKTINVSFPPGPDAPAPPADPRANAGALEVSRFAPVGDAPLSAQVSVTFSQPVAPVTSLAELAAADVPVKLTPQPAGRWRWVGTRTLLFEPEVRLPGATRFTASVPAGTRTPGGATLAAARSWAFQTPAVLVTATHPAGESQSRDALMFVAFDQKIDRAAVLRTVRVVAGGRAVVGLRLAADAEVRADETVRKLAADAGENRWLAFRASEPLAPGAQIQVHVGPGTPSAEGPLTTPAAQSFTFKTYGALSIRDAACGYQKRCSPFDSIRITFTNPLDAEAFSASQVKIEPAIPDADIQLHGQTVVIEGRKRGRTTYHVTLAAGIKDARGQLLGRDIVLVFNVGTADPALMSSTDGVLVVQDPHAPPRFSIYSVNHRALKFSLRAVKPEHWGQFAQYLRESNSGRNAQAMELPGRVVSEATAEVKAGVDVPVETQIDLAPALDGGFGQVVVVVEPAVRAREREERVVVWVQVTNIGLDAFVDRRRLTGWATSLKDGSPLAGVALEILSTGAQGATGAEGIAALELPTTEQAAKQSARRGRQENEPRVLVARAGKDVAMLPETFHPWGGGGWTRGVAGEVLVWYVFDDRKMYRPGEEVHVKGWIRRVGMGAGGDVSAHAGGGTVIYTLTDSRDNEITKGELKINALGGFDTALKLPPAMNLGYAHLTLKTTADGVHPANAQHQHSFQVQEFRRPEFEVGAQTSEGPHKIGGHAETIVNASYFAGGGLADAPVSWRVTSKPASFTPPNRNDFTFGKWTPWWVGAEDGGETHTEVFAGRTDADGKHRLRIDFESVEPARASSVEARASVTDVNRQQWTATTQLIVHPSDLYVGLRSPRTFVREGEPLVVESVVVDLGGRAITDRAVEVRAVRLDWAYVKGKWQERETDEQTCAVRSRAEAVECRFTPKAGGRYRVTARVRDDRERLNESELTLWVAGGRGRPSPRGVEAEKAELIPDRREYAAGEVAEILVQSPFVPAEGVLTLRRSGLVRTERFRMNEPTHTLRVPIEEGYTPNVHAQVDLVGAAARTDEAGNTQEKLPKRPAFASGELNLSVPPLRRKLTVAAAPREGTLEPGSETTVDVEVKDANGRAVAGGEVAVVVVDESVLALTGYKLDDPLSVFYSQREEGVSDHHLREVVQLASAADLTIRTGGGGAGGGGGGPAPTSALKTSGRRMMAAGSRAEAFTMSEMVSVNNDSAPPMPAPMATPMPQAQDGEQAAIRLRQNFNALAVFAAAVPTDARGRASVTVKVPDNLTRYRVMAVAVAGGKQFGAGESAITARSPLMVRPSAPRFLNFGDRVELPVVVQNQTDKPLDVSVAVRAANASLTDGAGRRLTVAANDRVEVRFPVAAEQAGTARFQVGAVAGKFSDAAEVSLPVWTPATTEAFAAYGEIDDGAIIQSVKAPANVLPQFGGLELTTSSTQLQELTDAYLYLSAYPYECAEQLSSRILAVAALKDVLAAFDVKDAPTPAEARAAVARDIKRLHGMQNGDGGFGFWRRGERSWPFVTVHVAHALARAKEKDFNVPPEMLEAVKQYLRSVEARVPKDYPVPAKRAIAAYALNVRMKLGERDAARARKLVGEAGLANLPLEAAGWLLPVLSGDAASAVETEAIRRHLANRVAETAATAHFVTSYGEEGDYLVLHSERRADAVILESLIIDQPKHDLIAKLARGLLAHRKAGRWSSTQENVFVLLALDRYFRTYESAVPNFTARAWLGTAYAGEMKFAGRTTDRQQVNVPMSYLLDAAKRQPAQNLAVAKEGAGRLYYRVGLTYAPANLQLDAADYGFTVERAYEAVDDPKDVRRDGDGTWHIKSGARVRVRLTMHAPSRRYHVALVDPLPAGLESLNPALAVTGDVPEDESNAPPRPLARGWWWNPRWFEHQNLRDERTEAFASLLSEGVHTYSYVARATTPGAFVVPPAKAEEMYHPETFGRGRTDKVVVED